MHRHPLTTLRARLGLSAASYLDLVDRQRRALGLGGGATRREKVSRWEAGAYSPDATTQAAMANLHKVPLEAVRRLGWPQWLLETDVLRDHGDDAVFRGPWTPAGTLAALTAHTRGDTMSLDRRGFLTVTGAALLSLAEGWSDAVGRPIATASGGGRQALTPAIVTELDTRLAALRRLDDRIGGARLRSVAVAEYDLLRGLAADTTHTDAVDRRLHTTLSEAARICGWTHFDAGAHAAAQRWFTVSLRASASAGDATAGAHTLSFLAIQTYSVGDPRDAVRLVETALETTAGTATPRTTAMLRARLARALSKTPDDWARAAVELDRAREAFAAGPHHDDPPWTYWLTASEIEMLAASCALDTGRPLEALERFDAARTLGYSETGYARDDSLYLARTATAHLDTGDVALACDVAERVLTREDGVTSTRSCETLADLRKRLKRYHGRHPAARRFLATATAPAAH